MPVAPITPTPIFSIWVSFREIRAIQTKTPLPQGNGVRVNFCFAVCAGYDPPFP